MAGNGPSPEEQKRRRNADTFEDFAVEIPADARGDAPKLPNRARKLKATCDWWDAWCESPVTAAWLSTDWQRLLMLSELVEQFWRTGDAKLMSEIRQNETLLGGTHVDRVRGRVKVASAGSSTTTPSVSAAPSGDNVADLDSAPSRRARLLAGDA